MASKQEVEIFLKELHVKIKVFGIIFFDDRGKNLQTLLDLEITPSYRKEIISLLRVEDYSQGPLDEKNARHIAYVGFRQKNQTKRSVYKNKHG